MILPSKEHLLRKFDDNGRFRAGTFFPSPLRAFRARQDFTANPTHTWAHFCMRCRATWQEFRRGPSWLCGLSKDELGLAQFHDVSLDLPPAGHRSNTMSVSCSGNKRRPAKRRKMVPSDFIGCRFFKTNLCTVAKMIFDQFFFLFNDQISKPEQFTWTCRIL
jgi:hypothetical protein